MIADDDSKWAEKRDAARVRTIKSARIAIKGVSTMDCTIRNMSLTGARLMLPNALALPDAFTIFIGPEATRRECEVMSRTEGSAGVRFTVPLKPRELGEEFVRSTSQPKPPRERMAAPAMETGAAATTVIYAASPPDLGRIEPLPLPQAVVSRLPW